MKKIIILTIVCLVALTIQANEKLETALNFKTISQGVELLNKWDGEVSTKLYRGIVYHNLAELDLKLQWIEDGAKILEEVYKEDKDPLALGYLGSIITIKGDYQFNKNDVIDAVLSLNEGSKKIDRAIEIAPENINLRFLRLMNGIAVSEASPIDRSEVVEDDLKFLESVLGKLSSDDKSMLYYNKGRFLLRGDDLDEGLTCLEKSISFSPQSTYGKNAKELLFQWEE